MKNIACLAPHKTDGILWLQLAPASVPLEKGFMRNASDIGHHGTGDLEVRISNDAALAMAMTLIERAYEES